MTRSYEYPPYGRMIMEWEQDIGGDGSPPSDWTTDEDWTVWRESMSTLLGHVLWPRYHNYKWVGPAEGLMDELTRADFELFKNLRPVINTAAHLAQGSVPQLQLFVLEDEESVLDEKGNVIVARGPAASLRRYLNQTLPDHDADAFAGAFVDGVHAKAGNVDLEIKRDMQRPRAYQMSVIIGEHWFTYHRAKSALTPSMISGHCVETLMGGAAAFYRATSLGADFPEAAWNALGQFAVDVGDRRVMAGVHYPSDNISSWLTGLLLCPKVCEDRRPIGWLWENIQTRSIVYKWIKKDVNSHSASPHRLAFNLLTMIGEGEIETVEHAMQYAKHSYSEGVEPA
jgi:hypothetical protein